jgi:hypothetical protein
MKYPRVTYSMTAGGTELNGYFLGWIVKPEFGVMGMIQPKREGSKVEQVYAHNIKFDIRHLDRLNDSPDALLTAIMGSEEGIKVRL